MFRAQKNRLGSLMQVPCEAHQTPSLCYDVV